MLTSVAVKFIDNLFVIGAAAMLMIIVGGCSPSPQTSQLRKPSSSQSASSNIGNPTGYDPSSMIEVQSFAALPDELKQQLNEWMTAAGEGPDKRARRFILAGVNKTSALIEYEEFGYVPSTYAAAYVHVQSSWTLVSHWRIGTVNTLSDLRIQTNRKPDE